MGLARHFGLTQEGVLAVVLLALQPSEVVQVTSVMSCWVFEQVAPGSAPGTGGPHFWTWTWAFHQEPDHSFANLSHELDLDLGGEPRDLCSSDAEGEPHQADHQTVSS